MRGAGRGYHDVSYISEQQDQKLKVVPERYRKEWMEHINPYKRITKQSQQEHVQIVSAEYHVASDGHRTAAPSSCFEADLVPLMG